MRTIVAISILLALVLSGCAAQNQGKPPIYKITAIGESKNYAVERVYFATDRNVTGSHEPNEMFGASLAALTYGSCEVSIPRDHRMGEMEAPNFLRLEFREDPEKHIVLLNVSTQTKDNFFSSMAERLRHSTSHSALLFVHGFDNSFADAARRTAQMTYDLGFSGDPVFYSWPSKGEAAISAYNDDAKQIELAQLNLTAFLRDFFARSDATNIYLVAHSMGNRALTRSISTVMSENPAWRPRLKEVILAAPDIDANIFKSQIGPSLAAMGSPITLYASSSDKALSLAKAINNGHARAGEAGPDLVIVDGIETIDATGVDTDLIGHSYYGTNRSILSDMFYLVREDKRPDNRFGIVAVNAGQHRYWTFKP
jgi:esterase/lipase superfamily enzyme